MVVDRRTEPGALLITQNIHYAEGVSAIRRWSSAANTSMPSALLNTVPSTAEPCRC